jgi:hypothetical protein
MNSILVIHPYKHAGAWVFDDPAVGLVREPFVAGADVVLDKLTAHIPDAATGVTIIVSGNPFPDAKHEFHRWREEFSGHCCLDPASGHEGCLCPALFKYFDTAPDKIYAEVRAKGWAGVVSGRGPHRHPFGEDRHDAARPVRSARRCLAGG